MNFDIFKEWGKKIPQRTWICFITSVVLGWLTHFYMLSNKLTNWDDVNSLHSHGAGSGIGRWFLEIVHPLGSRYSTPAIHGVIMIFFLALSACLVLEILQLKSTTAAILIGALMVTFPSVACVMTFMFTAHAYGLAIFMICLAIYLLRKYKWGMIPCSILLIGSLGIYQSYISIAIALMLMGMMIDILDGKDCKRELKTGIVYACILVVSVVIYMKICYVFNPNMANETYAGVGNMGQIELTEVPRLIGRCYKRFLEYFIWKPFAYMSTLMQVLNILTCVAAVIVAVLLVLKKCLYKKPFELALLGVVSFLMPLAVAFVYFMAPDAPFSVLMIYAYVMIYILVIALWEKLMQEWSSQQTAGYTKYFLQMSTLAIVGVISLSCYDNYLLTNTAYMRMQISYERVSSYFNRILANVEATPGYQQGDLVSIVGEFHYLDNPSPVDFASLYPTDSLRELSGVALENGLTNSGVRDNFIRNFLGFQVADLSVEEKNEIREMEEFKAMPNYPEEGSIAQIDGIWVVKLCE